MVLRVSCHWRLLLACGSWRRQDSRHDYRGMCPLLHCVGSPAACYSKQWRWSHHRHRHQTLVSEQPYLTNICFVQGRSALGLYSLLVDRRSPFWGIKENLRMVTGYDSERGVCFEMITEGNHEYFWLAGAEYLRSKVAHLDKRFPAFKRIRQFDAVFTRARYWALF